MTKPIIDVAIAIIFQDGKLLLTRRLKESHLADLWEFPGGKRLPSESWEECLLREIEEELGVVVKIDRPFQRIEHDYPDRTIVLQSYLCRLVGGEPRPLASQELQWISPQTLLSYPFPKANLPIIEALAEGVRLD